MLIELIDSALCASGFRVQISIDVKPAFRCHEVTVANVTNELEIGSVRRFFRNNGDRMGVGWEVLC